jgi:hypothetical protein
MVINIAIYDAATAKSLLTRRKHTCMHKHAAVCCWWLMSIFDLDLFQFLSQLILEGHNRILILQIQGIVLDKQKGNAN